MTTGLWCLNMASCQCLRSIALSLVLIRGRLVTVQLTGSCPNKKVLENEKDVRTSCRSKLSLLSCCHRNFSFQQKLGAGINKRTTGPFNITSAASRSGGQALGRQLLCIVSVLVDLCQRANETGPLVVSRNSNLLVGRHDTDMTHISNAGMRHIHIYRQ